MGGGSGEENRLTGFPVGFMVEGTATNWTPSEQGWRENLSEWHPQVILPLRLLSSAEFIAESVPK